jgi:hypothetical protein
MPKRILSFLTSSVYFLLATPVSASSHLGPGPSGILQLQELMLRLINISVNLGFFTTTAMLVWGGYKFIASGGEAKPLQEAWSVVTWSLLGIVFLAFSWLILRLVESFTGVPVSSAFCLGFPGAPTNCSFNK